MAEISTGEAASTLGVSVRQVESWVAAGRLVSVRQVGGRHMVAASSVRRLQLAPRRRGRTWSEATSWAGLALLSGLSADWVYAEQMTRLRHRLRKVSAEDLQYFMSARASVHRYRASVVSLDEVGKYVVATGVSALRELEMSVRFGLAQEGPATGVDGYVLAGDRASVVAGLHLVPDPDGEVTLRSIERGVGFDNGSTPIAAIALDLMDSLVTRERSAGQHVLSELLGGR